MTLNPSVIITSINLGILAILFLSIFFFSKSYLFSSSNLPQMNATLPSANLTASNNESSVSYTSGPFAMTVLKLLALLSVVSLIVATNAEFNGINVTLSLWLANTPTNISLNFIYDQYFLLFLTVALIVTWSIMEFSFYYMADDPNGTAFFRLLTIFLLNMLLLTCSNSLFLIFLGWEGVGFLSFLLISWWTTRNDASSSALEAVIYNRIGDIGLITFMALSILTLNSWNLTEILSSSNIESSFLPFLLFGLILAAAGKSAQFGLHPWLPAAMEGPTPVSALLHSSTMVVAGVFLLVRTSDLFVLSPSTQSVVLILGGITALFAASTAIAQHDIKKIIAYSTTSQLGLMVSSIGIGQPILAFFHICTHAFFKAMLFLCSGSIIHSLSDEQDLRKMGGLSKLLPVTSACLALGSLALMGTPFLAGFYSKDLILEAASASFLNTLGLSLSIVATMLTAVYSFRIVYFCFSLNPSINVLSPIGEEDANLSNALLRLSLGTIISGWFFSNFILSLPSFNVSPSTKSLPLVVTILGVALLFSALVFLSQTPIVSSAHSTLTSQWFFVDIIHSITTLTSFISSLFLSSRTLDRGWQEEIGPQGIAQSSTFLSKANQSSQIGLIKRYILSSIISIAVIIALSFVVLS
ncbi:NADH dehydrogenase subunit 5 (mitochondrion) [Lytechinus variegatus]|uniref:NADH-ubiquinone oxidoreductase chain 5 n=1 Tax=Lytechinus variegatus TaxID=7654 RepID=A0A2S0X102_LYTVA|nr:NADH dehydrogenase subunit 5 [Lytechinus variegatus]AWB97758.1 NADH dehydrogenase subunit 5 [Lytechinus variegatus]